MQMIRRPPGDYRPSRRSSCVSARLLVDGEDLGVLLLDISRDGAKVSVPFAVLPGTAVSLALKDAVVPALVQWSKDRVAGLRFLDRLGRKTLVDLEGSRGENDVLG